MAEMGSYKNVFDDQSEFNKLNDLILGAIQEFSEYRKGNLTYGEIMFVLECVLDSMRGTSESEASKNLSVVSKTKDAPSFSMLLSITSRMVETMLKKGIIDADDERFILHGDD